MPAINYLPFDLSDEESSSSGKLEEALHKLVSRQQAAIHDIHCLKGDDANKVNTVAYEELAPPEALPPSKIRVTDYADSDAGDKQALAFLVNAGHHEISYSRLFLNKADRRVLVSEPGRQLTLRGKMSTFGGPNDTGMTPTEGLAIIQNSDIGTVPGVKELFIDPARGALGRNLNNKKAAYIACRWDYRVTPRSYLAATNVIVRNPITGKQIAARPVDWGPAEWTHRVADLSDFVADELGLQTNGECEVLIPLPGAAAEPLGLNLGVGADAFRTNLIQVANSQLKKFGGINEGDEPLRSRIKAYWDELRQFTGDANFAFQNVDVAWSAVFVSWCMMQAGAQQADFRFSPRHSAYANNAIRRARTNPPATTFIGLPIDQYAPQPGDIIQNNRAKPPKTYDDAAQDDSYESHAAIVVAVTKNADGPCAVTIGGNESDSVRTHQVLLDANGKIQQRGVNPYICVIKTT